MKGCQLLLQDCHIFNIRGNKNGYDFSTSLWSPTHIWFLACEQYFEPGVAVFWEALPSSWLKKMLRSTAKCWMKLRLSNGRVGGRIEGPRVEMNSTGRPRNQLTWTLGDFQRLNQQPKSIHELDLPTPHAADVQPSLHAGLPTAGARVIPNALACL